MAGRNGDQQPFDWTRVHPTRLAILEAMARIGRELSATDVQQMLNEELGVSIVSYHFKVLSDAAPPLITMVRREPVRGTHENFYYFTGAKPGG